MPDIATVIHRYYDDDVLNWIQGIPKAVRLYVYDEGGEPIFEKSQIPLGQDPNVTFVNHIINRYDALDASTFFVTGRVNSDKFILNQVITKIKVSGFGWIRNKIQEPHWKELSDTAVDEFASQLFEEEILVPRYMYYTPPQFVVDAPSIRKYPRSLWEKIAQRLPTTDSTVMSAMWSYLLLYRNR